MTELLAALGLKFKTVIAAGLGALISLKFYQSISALDKAMTWFSGLIFGAFWAEPLGAYFGTGERAEAAWALLIGVFGMALTAKVVEVVRDTQWAAILKGRFGGGA